jgi:predicted phosphodiesterase
VIYFEDSPGSFCKKTSRESHNQEVGNRNHYLMSGLPQRFVLVIVSLLVAGCTSYLANSDPTISSQVNSPELALEPVSSPTPASSAMSISTAAPTITAAPTATPFVDDILPAAVLDGDLPLSDISYRIPLTIRHVSQNAVTLFFELDRPTPVRLFIRSPGAAVQSVEVNLDPEQTRHLVTVEDLSPDTDYEAIVAIEIAEDSFEQPAFLSQAWGPVTYHTPAGSGSLRIGVIGDASFGDPVTTDLVNAMAGADLDFVLHAGDVVDETAQDVDPFLSYAEKFYTPFAPLLKQLPVYTVIGNHDYDADIRWLDAPFYYYAFPPFPDPLFPAQGDQPKNQYYAFVYHDIQFLMLDTQVFFGQPGRDEQQAWLNERLADSTFRMTIPVFHVAPFSSSSVHATDSLPVQATWSPLFESANVPVVFSGHFHQYERLRNNGLTYIVSGGGSSILYAPGELIPQSEVFKRQSHFVLLEIDEEGIRLTAIARGGEVIDQLGISP